MKKILFFILLYTVFLVAGMLRITNADWDGGYHMHPDERAIILSVIKLSFPASPTEFFSPDSTWNPKFFAYGSMPFYLLSIVGNTAGILQPTMATYDGLPAIGRYLSAFFDLGTLIFIFLLGKCFLSRKYALLAAFFYGISVLPIQLSHFYAVDTILTFFITGTLFFLLKYYETLSIKYVVLIGIFFGAALATKISASLLLVSIGTALVADYVLLFVRQPHKPKQYLPHLPLFLRRLITHSLIITVLTFITFVLLEPYAVIDFPTFMSQTIEQSHMTDSAFTFPYTLQYVGKIPYMYELRNLLLFGQGPILGFITLSGILLLSIHAVMKGKRGAWAKEFILVIYFWVYFLIVGSFAIGFMRYMLPLYPLLALAGAFFVYQGVQLFPILLKRPFSAIIGGLCLVLLLIWPLSFSRMYEQDSTRIQASNWIHTYIPPGQVLAIEHWDDALPLTDQAKYSMLTLPLYDPDTPEKWTAINAQLAQTDYIILASNRLYTPLMKLTDCAKLPAGRCYTQTAAYYRGLFDGSLGFTKVADITSYPKIPFTSISLPDQSADESFTVYDHPRIIIFKKTIPRLP